MEDDHGPFLIGPLARLAGQVSGLAQWAPPLALFMYVLVGFLVGYFAARLIHRRKAG